MLRRTLVRLQFLSSRSKYLLLIAPTLSRGSQMFIQLALANFNKTKWLKPGKEGTPNPSLKSDGN